MLACSCLILRCQLVQRVQHAHGRFTVGNRCAAGLLMPAAAEGDRHGVDVKLVRAQLAQHAGYQLDFSCIDPDELMVATIWSAQGVETMLRQLFREMLSPLAD